MAKEKIFLSAVTGQFEACREALRSDLSAVGADVRVQEDFTQHGGTLLEKLETYITDCDRIIALIGSAYGWQPEVAALPPNTLARSYTQWEYYFARGERLDGSRAKAKPVHVYIAAPAYLNQHPVEQSAAETERQQRFVDELLASGKDRNEFDSIDRLARLVLRDGFKLSSASHLLRQNLPYDSLGFLFKGRDDILANIEAKLLAGTNQVTAIVAKQAIHGLGGVGKSRLAVEYAWRHLPDYSACLFVIADSSEGLERNLAALCNAEILDLPEQAAQEQELQVAAVLHWLAQNPGWLLILDNVDTPEAAQAVDRRLPKLHNGQVLITSRRTDWDDSIGTLSLDTLAEADATAFLLEKTKDKRTPADTDDNDARRLAATLGGLALALEQAGAFINRKRISVSEYLDRWARQEKKLREFPVKHYPKPLAVTWETSFEQLTPAAQALLNVLSWFAPDAIPRVAFQAAFDADILAPLLGDVEAQQPDDGAPVDLEDLLEELESLSLVKWESGNRSFSVHRVVQEITRTRLGSDVRTHTLLTAVELINNALPADPPPDDVRAWPLWDPLRPHVEQLVWLADKAGLSAPTTRLMNDLGLYLKAKALLGEAEPLYRRALAIDEQSFGAEHPDVARDLNNLALLLQATNRLAEAEPLMRRALAIDEASVGAEHPDVARDLNNLAALLQATNRLAEAEPLMRRALAIDEASFGAEHPDVARDLNNLAALLQATNRLAEAEPLMRRALAIDEASFGAEHPRVAIDLNNLAQLLKDTNRLAEAEPLMRRALAIDEESFGPEHPKVAIRLNNLAQLLQATNRLTEAEPLMRRALAIDEQSYGAEHPDVARDLNNLALLLQATNRLAEAEPLMRRALAIDGASFGPKHPEVASDLNNLAQLLQATNRLAEAEPLYRRTLAIDEASFGAEHPRVAIDLNNLAQLLKDTNRLGEAEPLYRRALAIDEQSYGAEHPNVAIDLNNLAQLLQATNRLAEAEPLMRRALAIDEASVGAEHPRVATRLNNLAQLLQDTNRLAEAEPLMRRALAIDEASVGAEHPDVARDLNNLAQLLQDTNRLAEAEPLMRRALAIDEQSYGVEHPNVAIDLNNLAGLLQDTNRLGEAEPLYRRAFEIDEQSYGAEHPNVAIDLNNLALLLQATNRLEEAEPLMRRALAIDEQSYSAEHPNVAIRLNNLAQLLQATNRLGEAEPLSRRVVEILLLFTMRTGHEHPYLKTVLANYVGLLAEMGHDESQQKKIVDTLTESVGNRISP